MPRWWLMVAALLLLHPPSEPCLFCIFDALRLMILEMNEPSVVTVTFQVFSLGILIEIFEIIEQIVYSNVKHNFVSNNYRIFGPVDAFLNRIQT